jgi:hypothetical protein
MINSTKACLQIFLVGFPKAVINSWLALPHLNYLLI